MYEHRSQRVMPLRVYAWRQARHTVWAGGLIAVALGIGTAGYQLFEHLGWLDAFYSATMILTGMGPAHEARTSGGKLFVSGYALLSAGAFLTAASVLVAPALHRLLHRLHVEMAEEDKG